LDLEDQVSAGGKTVFAWLLSVDCKCTGIALLFLGVELSISGLDLTADVVLKGEPLLTAVAYVSVLDGETSLGFFASAAGVV
jgi:hypothetical protein